MLIFRHHHCLPAGGSGSRWYRTNGRWSSWPTPSSDTPLGAQIVRDGNTRLLDRHGSTSLVVEVVIGGRVTSGGVLAASDWTAGQREWKLWQGQEVGLAEMEDVQENQQDPEQPADPHSCLFAITM